MLQGNHAETKIIRHAGSAKYFGFFRSGGLPIVITDASEVQLAGERLSLRLEARGWIHVRISRITPLI